MKNRKRIAMLVVIICGATVATIVNADWSTASSDTVKMATIITKSGCKPIERACYTEQIGDSIVTHKGQYFEKTITKE